MVNGQDINSLAGSHRKHIINGNSQDGFIFDGTIRQNLDPSCTSSTSHLSTALQQVDMLDLVQEMGGVDSPCGPATFTTNQQQMLCLARAISQAGQVVLLDEVTSGCVHPTLDPKLSSHS